MPITIQRLYDPAKIVFAPTAKPQTAGTVTLSPCVHTEVVVRMPEGDFKEGAAFSLGFDKNNPCDVLPLTEIGSIGKSDALVVRLDIARVGFPGQVLYVATSGLENGASVSVEVFGYRP